MRAPSIILPGLTRARYLTDNTETCFLSLSQSLSLTLTYIHCPPKNLINLCNHQPILTSCLMHNTDLIVNKKSIHLLKKRTSFTFTSNTTWLFLSVGSSSFGVGLPSDLSLSCCCSGSLVKLFYTKCSKYPPSITALAYFANKVSIETCLSPSLSFILC